MLQYSPKAFEKTPIEEGAQAEPTARANDTLSLVTWNLGYAGLDHTADFFMDGGQQVLPKNQDLVQSNLQAVTDWLLNNQSDIVLLQEVDSRSKRTFQHRPGIPHSQSISSLLSSTGHKLQGVLDTLPVSSTFGAG